MDYAEVADQITAKGNTTLELRRRLAAKVFATTSKYDGAIANYLAKAFGTKETSTETLPANLRLDLPRAQSLRYGENPHQNAALYGKFSEYFKQLHGKELSYNNILDLTSAAMLISEFEGESPTLAILKHTNPCGVGQGSNLRDAWDKAFATDKQAPFGGIIAVNRMLDAACAEGGHRRGNFQRGHHCARFRARRSRYPAKEKKPASIENCRKSALHELICKEVRSVGAESVLAQQPDSKIIRESDLKIVTKRKPTDAEKTAMLFGWRVVGGRQRLQVERHAVTTSVPAALLQCRRWPDEPR